MITARAEKKAFTLIELLIVVAIIAILAAIAVPNFLEAQVRSKVSRAKADMRSLATAMEAYMVDHNTYMAREMPYVFPAADATSQPGQISLTTPVAYITKLPLDVFWEASDRTSTADDPLGRFFGYTCSSSKVMPGSRAPGSDGVNWGPWPHDMYMNTSAGPDRLSDETAMRYFPNLYADNRPVYVYDATNGTVSQGDILRWVCLPRYNIVLEVGYDPGNGVDPTDGAYEDWKTGL